jgi:cysteine desulfurase
VRSANNETGVVQPVGEVARALRDSEVVVHTDAVQFIVSRPASLSELGVDMLTISGHKLGGPKGVGALVMRPGIHLEPVIHGGGQELGRRSGTHDVAGIVGMTAALDAAVRDRMRLADDVAAARDEFEESLKALVPSAVITAHEAERLAQHSHFRIPGIDAETMLVRLDALGVAAAAGSACHSGALEVSHVLTAMGMRPAEARECVRFSFGWTTRRQDGKAAALAVLDALEGLL